MDTGLLVDKDTRLPEEVELNDKSERIDAQLYIEVSARKILTGVRREDPDSSLKSRDVYNYRRKKHVEFLNGRTPIQALLMALPEEGDWIFNYQAEDEGSSEDKSSLGAFLHIYIFP